MTKELKIIYFVSAIRLDRDKIPPENFNSWNQEDINKYPFPVTVSRLGFFFEESFARKTITEEWSFTREDNWYQWIVIESMFDGFYSNYSTTRHKDSFMFFTADKNKKDKSIELDKTPKELVDIYEQYERHIIFAWD